MKGCKIAGVSIIEGFMNKSPIKERMDLIQKDCDEEHGGRPEPADKGPVKMDDIDDPATWSKKDAALAPSPSKAPIDPEGKL